MTEKTPADIIRDLASKGTQGRLVVSEFESGVDLAVPPEKPRVIGFGCGTDFFCDLNDGEYHEYLERSEQVANARRIALMADANTMRLIADVLDAVRQLGNAPTDSQQEHESECALWDAQSALTAHLRDKDRNDD